VSGLSSQGAGAAACANADVVNAVSAAAIKKVLIGNIVIAFSQRRFFPVYLNKSRTLIQRQYDGSFRRSVRLETL
jgi:hypothetical protein